MKYFLNICLIVLIGVNCAIADTGSDLKPENEWIYDYSSKISKKVGLVRFSIFKNKDGNLLEKASYDLQDNNFNRKEAFVYERPLPIGNIVVDSVHPLSLRAYHEFSPYLLLNGDSSQKLDSSSFKKSTPRFSYLDDSGWLFSGQYVGIEKIKFGEREYEASKFKFYGSRPTYLAHCRQGQEGEISSEVWYVKGIDRYVKQVVNTFHCRIAGPGFHLDEEIYQLLPNSSVLAAINEKESLKELDSQKIKIDASKEECKALGFTDKTENFGNCVLRLIK